MKCKDTLLSLTCSGKQDLSPLRDSTQLRKLKLKGDISYGNFNVIRTFSNLEELETNNYKLISLFKESQALKTLIYNNHSRARNNARSFDFFPQSVTKLSLERATTFDQVKIFLEKNPFLKELTIQLPIYEVAALTNLFKHVKFTFIINRNFFTFSQCYICLHPECKQIGIPGSEPDHVLYELLFKRIADKRMLFEPYLKAAWNWRFELSKLKKTILNAPPEMMECLSTFNEFKNFLRIEKQDSDYFENLFYFQMSTDDDEYLRIIVTAYDEVFQLQADIHNTVTILKAMGWKKRRTLKRERFFDHCRHNWIKPIIMRPLENEEFQQSNEY
ncbi:hypothetical protein FGO68_gene6072 [Halteria grandinella]|uniref:Uncharacterized protein n=1 Tax=Halteria grandinella TaxID=5974 RepID=A0A8J8T5S8_HALGN|nr:hypothetical protein FGO68_gene6072 [Halteria grandinella]